MAPEIRGKSTLLNIQVISALIFSRLSVLAKILKISSFLAAVQVFFDEKRLNKWSLESLEEFITKLIFLQHIDFSENNISEISTELINRWRYLRTANLSKNQISTLPKGIRNMQHLGKLDLRKLFHPFFFKYFSQI